MTGYALAHSRGVYIVLTIISVLGGVSGGFEHPNAASGARRVALGGLLYGLGIVIAHAATGKAVAKLPHPAILLCLVTILAGACLGAIGGWLRGRYAARAGGGAAAA